MALGVLHVTSTNSVTALDTLLVLGGNLRVWSGKMFFALGWVREGGILAMAAFFGGTDLHLRRNP